MVGRSILIRRHTTIMFGRHLAESNHALRKELLGALLELLLYRRAFFTGGGRLDDHRVERAAPAKDADLVGMLSGFCKHDLGIVVARMIERVRWNLIKD